MRENPSRYEEGTERQRRQYVSPRLQAVGYTFEVTMGGSPGGGDSGPPNFDLPSKKRGAPPPPLED